MEIDREFDLEWVSGYGPRFTVSGDNIEVLDCPAKFYQSLLSCIKSSRKRIFISTLYIGTGLQEKSLVSCIEQAITDHPKIQIRILMDYCRGTRGTQNSCTLLQPMINLESKGDVKVFLYHTPDLRGLLKRVLPERWREAIGVQHMKIYIFDDNLIISGANLSDSYFTDRQDRYMLIRDAPGLADYLADVQSSVQNASFVLGPTGGVHIAEECSVHPFTSDGVEYHEMLRSKVVDVIERRRKKRRVSDLERKHDTVIYPLIQMGNIGIHDNNQVHRYLFATQVPNSGNFDLASGYFNLVNDYENLIAYKSRIPFRILAAAPKANGFFTGSGISKFIPSLYVHVMNQFYKIISKQKDKERVGLFEYERNDWTFHAKGVWWSPTNETQPAMTLIGSPNYGYRSVGRDLEMELMIMTQNQKLRNQLDQERRGLFQYARPVQASTFQAVDHFVPFWVRFVSRFIRSFF